MEILTCPHCQTRVVLTAGQCPSCRTNVAPVAVQVEEKTSPPPSELAMFSEKEFVAVESARDSKNPYQSPQFVAVKPKRGGLLWLLFSFEGRIPRSYYWGSQMGVLVCSYAFVFAWAAVMQHNEAVFSLVMLGVYALVLWSNLAVTVKRLHDRDVSGYFVLVAFIPFIGGLLLFIEVGCLGGSRGWNKYGPPL